eukprot:1163093-Rhodomonas_salina.1
MEQFTACNSRGLDGNGSECCRTPIVDDGFVCCGGCGDLMCDSVRSLSGITGESRTPHGALVRLRMLGWLRLGLQLVMGML